jgi:F-type H+-transporting ATPase subunit delta
MKRPVTAARRYAEAAFQIATRDGTTEQWQERLDRLGALLDDDRVARVAANPALPQDERERMLGEALGWEALGSDAPGWATDDPAFNLVRLLLRRGRIRLASGIAREFRRLVQRASGIVPATVMSASELSPAEEDAIRARLEKMTGGKVELAFELDPSLIGGVAVRIGDRMIDASVRGRLERLREHLMAGVAG